MNTKKVFFLLTLSLGFLFIGCQKEEAVSDPTYVDTWYLIEVTGGIHGWGYTPDFDVLELKRNARCALRKEQVLLSEGAYSYDESVEEQLTLSPDEEVRETNLFEEENKKVTLTEYGALILSDPCCDLFTYRFSSSEE